MSEDTLISVLEANRLMRSPDEVTAFETALAELARYPKLERLPDLHLVLDDRCEHQEVMFGLVHFLESFDVNEQVWAFVDVIPKLIKQSPNWTKILHVRILNDDLALALYRELLSDCDFQNLERLCQFLENIAIDTKVPV